MTIYNLGISVEQLHKGCILSTITSAIMLPRYMLLSHEYGWDKNNFCVNDSCGGRAVITFSKDSCVGALQTLKSKRYRSSSNIEKHQMKLLI